MFTYVLLPLMTDTKVSEATIEALAQRLEISLSSEECADFATLVEREAAGVASYRPPSFSLPDPVSIDRSERRPADGEQNIWITRFDLESNDGPLSGLRIGVKDNIAVAGYPMTCGSSVLDEFEPTIDATVVRRLLQAGARLVGKTNMEAFAWSGSSDISDYGTVPNPYDSGHLAGGSSSGSAAAVAVGDCEATLGGDQGGSIRIPSAWCGVVGLKPTHGLVPYTGVYPLDPTIDHVGPIATNVETTAKVLSSIAGEDRHEGIRLDSRQPPGVSGDDYQADLGADPGEFTIGVLAEGFGWDAADPGVEESVRNTIAALETAGVTVETVSVPAHRDTLSLIAALETQGGHRTVAEDGVPTHRDGWYWTELARSVRSATEQRADQLPPTVKGAALLGEYLVNEHGIEPYADAKNAVLGLRQAYNRTLAERDALVMPTVPMKPFERDDDMDRLGRLARIVENHRNTASFDHTHHPALSVPCGRVDGLPVGIQLVGSSFDERTLLALGEVVESI